jgi:hypothetical protein
MTVLELALMVGATGVARFGDLSVPVVVSDVRLSFGRTDVLVSPVGGSGNQWVDVTRVTLGGAS